MSRKLDEIYLEWLYDQIKPITHTRTYLGLCELMLHKEFIWTIPNDDNRVEDGLDLRIEFVNEIGQRRTKYAPPHDQLVAGASFLEVLVGLSRRLEDNAGGTAQSWAWHLVKNLNLHHKHDRLSRRSTEQIEETLDRVIWRVYDADGMGGFFPLAFSEHDQRQVELWYQMNAYIQENPEL